MNERVLVNLLNLRKYLQLVLNTPKHLLPKCYTVSGTEVRNVYCLLSSWHLGSNWTRELLRVSGALALESVSLFASSTTLPTDLIENLWQHQVCKIGLTHLMLHRSWTEHVSPQNLIIGNQDSVQETVVQLIVSILFLRPHFQLHCLARPFNRPSPTRWESRAVFVYCGSF